MEALQELKIIQDKERGILREFIRVCDKYDLKYFLVEGSMLGAVRHGGMIPWDDDIDVALYREDFEKFIQVCESELSTPYKCDSFCLDESRIDYLTQMVDTSTLVETHFKKHPKQVPIWIDVFILDGTPKGKKAGKLHNYRLLHRKLKLMWSDLDNFVVNRENRPAEEKILMKTGRVLHTSKLISTRKQLLKMDRAMKKIPVSPENNVINFMSEYKGKSEFPYEYFGDGKTVDFDGMSVRIPEKAELILGKVYGNYMEYPPESERYKHKLKLIKY